MRRTLQEGVISAICVFQFRRSFAILGILHLLVEQLRHDITRDPFIFRVLIRILFGENFSRTRYVAEKLDHDPLTGAMAVDLLRIVKASLDIQPLHDYPRRPVSFDRI